MPKQEYAFSGYKSMWLIAMFDLPVKTKKERKIYAGFRKSLLELGFSMIQFSVYVRFCGSEELAQKHRRTIRKALPEHGQVRVLTLTDRQFEKMENYVGKLLNPNENAPRQLTFF
ncbi:MAG: CRISPR-associated endonuclease Cas2 [Planctomycetaceae bacterium]|jgi:CRISPR-associated protein Cas2|nr:CRISPR-associated endonuclease Cas2 [Planctomycetaceae bacterium]